MATSTVLNAVGGVATLLVSIVAATKFTSGAWVPILVIPLIVLVFKGIKRHYRRVAESLEVPDDYRPPRRRHTVVVLAGDVHAGLLDSLAYGASLADHLLAVKVVGSVTKPSRAEEVG